VAENVLNQYRVIAKLGRGGMADVFLAAAQGPGGFSKLLVLKVLQDSLSQSPDFVAMFRDEARLAARLNHPNVVQTYEVGESDGRHFMAMEYLEGQSLSRIMEVLGRQGGLTPALGLRVVIDALAGLQYAHELPDFRGAPLGIVHRDITPQNVFVTYEGQVKVVDFGIAKANDSTTETIVGTVKGKVAYMAPEQARGEAVDRRADVFGAAVVLWELLAGRRLWDGLTDIAVIGRLVQGDVPDLGALRPELPPGLTGACMRALSPKPEDRPQSAAEFQRDLEAQYENLETRLSQRRIGELVRESFTNERAQVHAVVQKQLERLARTTPTGETPPQGFRLAQAGVGDMPILGEGSAVHEAVTALHTGLTGPRSSAPARTFAGTSEPVPVSRPPGAKRGWLLGLAAVALVGLGVAVGPLRAWLAPPAPPERAQSSFPELPAARHAATATAAQLRPERCNAKNKPLVELTGEIGEDATLDCTRDYLIRFTASVAPGVTLTIEPGTTLHGDAETRGVLLVQPGARLMAEGTRDAPIVFTSDRPEGQRKAGDWGGLIVLGLAPINLRDAAGKPTTGRVEGLNNGGEYGGSNPQDSSGVISFVRIEYSGTEIAPNNEVNGLTLAGVGRGTRIHHVQVRHTADDCFEFFGGTVDARHLICQHPDDDAFDWDYGYTGRLQFLVAQSSPEPKEGSHGFEGDNDPRSSQNEPISAPTIYNVTLCGKNRTMEAKEHYGALLRRGTRGRIRNAIFTGFGAGLDVQDAVTKPNIAASIFFGNLVYNLGYPESAEYKRTERLLYDDDQGFDEVLYLTNPGLRISERDPGLGGCFEGERPNFKPRAALIENAAEPDADGFFDTRAVFVGAFRDQSDDWDQGDWVSWAAP